MDRTKRLRTLALVLCLVPLCACWVKEEVGKKMQADIAAIQMEMEVVKRANADEKQKLVSSIQQADQKIAELQKVIEEYHRATGRNAADFGVDIERLKSQLMELRGQLEVSEHRLAVLEGRVGGGTRAPAEAAKPDQPAQPVIETKSTDPLSAIKRPDKQDEFYKLAYGLLEGGQHEAARQLFTEFLEKWPKGDYADNATYWIGESYYAEGKYREAALTFEKVRRSFPKGDKAGDALLKLGYCFFEMGKYKESLPFLQEFVQAFPKSKLAADAKKRIDEAKKKAGK